MHRNEVMVVFNDWHHGIIVMDTMVVQNGGFWFSLGWHDMGLYRCLFDSPLYLF